MASVEISAYRKLNKNVGVIYRAESPWGFANALSALYGVLYSFDVSRVRIISEAFADDFYDIDVEQNIHELNEPVTNAFKLVERVEELELEEATLDYLLFQAERDLTELTYRDIQEVHIVPDDTYERLGRNELENRVDYDLMDYIDYEQYAKDKLDREEWHQFVFKGESYIVLNHEDY